MPLFAAGRCRTKGSIILAVWPEMLLSCLIAIAACFLRQWQGPDEYIITDVKGHATLGTTLAFLNVFRSNLSYGRCVLLADSRVPCGSAPDSA